MAGPGAHDRYISLVGERPGCGRCRGRVGCCAAGLGAIDDPVGRRRGLIGFAHAHILFGAMLMAQSIAARSATIPAPLAGLPLTVGLVLLYLAITGPGPDFPSPLPALVPFDPRTTRNTRLMVRNKRSI